MENKMKALLLKSFLIITVSIVVINFSYSQESVKKSSDSVKCKEEVSNSLKAKEWAIMFAIGTNFSLTNFDDAAIALKYHISPHSALRLNFDVSYFNENESNQTTYSETGNSINQIQTFGGNLAFLYYINTKEKFNIYFDLGINYSYEKRSYSSSFISNKGSRYYNDKSTGWFLGPKIGAGAEYFIFKSMSAFAEYNYFFGFGNQSNNTTDGIVSYSSTTEKTLFGKDYLKFGISIYF
jgi:opacity protein-like surface antigen